jgi:hypothetical protein
METPNLPATTSPAEVSARQMFQGLTPDIQTALIKMALEAQGYTFEPDKIPDFNVNKKKLERTGEREERRFPRRGVRHLPDAEAFAQAFPLSAEWIYVEHFDKWAGDRGLYTYLPHKEYVGKDEDGKGRKRATEWMAMLRWRDLTIKNINDAALTRTMETSAFGSFFIERRYNEFRRVLPYVHASDLALRLEKVPGQAQTMRESLEDALMATVYQTQHIGVKFYVATLHAEVLKYEDDVRKGYAEINNKHHALLRMVRMYVDLGWMPAEDPLVRALLPHALFAPSPQSLLNGNTSTGIEGPLVDEQRYQVDASLDE